MITTFLYVALAALLGVGVLLITNPHAILALPLIEVLKTFNLLALAPEFIIAIVLLYGVLHLAFVQKEEEREGLWLFATIGCVASLVCLLFHLGLTHANPHGVGVFCGGLNGQDCMLQNDLFSILIRTFLVLGTLLIIGYSRLYLKNRSELPGEFYVIMLTALLGGMLMAGATNLIMLFVAIETLGISSYIMVSYLRGNAQSAEAGLKYLIYGGIATAILLFGFSLLYGLTGTTNLAGIAQQLVQAPTSILLPVMFVLILGGFSFKLSAAPFHMWTPDVYEGAPTPVTAFLSVVSKIAGFSVAVRFLAALAHVGNFTVWFGVLAVVSALSMVIGNVVALTQKNIKRLLAYSTIAHAGYLLLGLTVVASTNSDIVNAGLASLVYYLLAYLFMNVGAFAAIIHFSDLTNGREDIAAYAGLVRKKPTLTFVLSIMLLSLSGIPITAGFFGKFFLFQAVASAGRAYLWLVMLALLTSTVSLYYYLNVIRLMVIAEPSDAVARLQSDSENNQNALLWTLSPTNLIMTVCLYGTLLMGLFAQPLMNLAQTAVQPLSEHALMYSAQQQEPLIFQRAHEPELSQLPRAGYNTRH